MSQSVRVLLVEQAQWVEVAAWLARYPSQHHELTERAESDRAEGDDSPLPVQIKPENWSALVMWLHTLGWQPELVLEDPEMEMYLMSPIEPTAGEG